VGFGYKVAMGAEARLLDFLLLRAGFHQGYPGFGLGLHPWLLHLDYAYFGEELGSYPGQRSSYNHLFSVGLSF